MKRFLTLGLCILLLCAALPMGGLAEELPALRRLSGYTTVDLNDPVGKLAEELTGYEMTYDILPAENATQTLLLQIAGGEAYDIMKITSVQAGLLNAQNALIPLDDLLAAHGDNLLAAISENGWKSVSSGGKIFAIPLEARIPATDHPMYGYQTAGMGVRSDVRERLGLSLPTNLEELLPFLRAIQADTGKEPVTSNTPYITAIMSAYGISNTVEWYDVDGVYTPLVKMPALVDYLAFVQALYAEKLLDSELPINTGETMNAKFAGGSSPVRDGVAFWDIPALLPALHEGSPDANIEFITMLGLNADSKPINWVVEGVAIDVYCIPKTSKHPEDAIKHLNALSSLEAYTRMNIGVQDESFYIDEQGNYFPILPEFNFYNNANNFGGLQTAAVQVEQWFARARKTPEMAVAFEAMNANLSSYEPKVSLVGYSYAVEEAQQYRSALNTVISDGLMKAIIEQTDAQAAVDALIAQWEGQGGLEFEAGMQAWYDQNKP